MKFIANPGRRVNRNGKTYIADSKGVIESDTPEIQAIFKAYGFKSVEGTITRDTQKEPVKTEVKTTISPRSRKKSKK